MQELDFEWFKENYTELYRRYGECHIAIKAQCVLGIYGSHIEAVKETSKTEELGTFIVQKCDGSDEAYSCYIASTCFTD